MKNIIFAFIVIATIQLNALAAPPPIECWTSPTTVKTPSQCCQLPDLIPSAVFQKCEEANPKPATPTGPGAKIPRGCCISECVLNETKIMTNGILDKAVALKYLTQNLTGDAEAIKVVTAAVDFCEKEGIAKKPDYDEMAKLPVPAGEKSCNMISGYMIGCVNGQVYKNCPKDKFGADPACNGIKAFVEKCGFLYPAIPMKG